MALYDDDGGWHREVETALAMLQHPLPLTYSVSNNSSKTALRLDNDNLENGSTLGYGHFIGTAQVWTSTKPSDTMLTVLCND